MNITHAVKESITGDRLQAIFARQGELMEKYHHIESRSGLCQTEDCPVNLDDKRGQARIKDFAWRITEELGEAIDGRDHSYEHFVEELIDALHFMTEMTILCGFSYDTLGSIDGPDYLETIYGMGAEQHNLLDHDFNSAVAKFICELGMMCNCLKNKPWKQSHMRTDKLEFQRRLINVWVSYFAILVIAGLTSDDVADIYLKKSQVNKFRQRSNY